MLNLNLMHINDDYSFPSDLHDSENEHQQSIKVENTYELNSNSDSEEGQDQENRYRQSFEIDHSLDDLSIEHDTFLQTLQRERLSDKIKTVHPSSYFPKDGHNYLSVNKNKIQMTLIQSQSVEETICFTNITSFSIKVKFNECPFQIHSQKSLSFVQAKQLEIILEPLQEASITFLIKSQNENYGDIIQNVVITSEFIGREEAIAPIQINFNIHYIVPRLHIKFEGRSQSISLARNKISVVRLKANKFGEYSLELGLIEGNPKMTFNVETRGKMTCFTSTLTLTGDNVSSIKLRKKSVIQMQEQEKYVLLLKSTDTKLCFMLGVEFLS